MKKLIFYICTFALVSFTVGTKLGFRNEYYNTCLTENNVSDDDMLTIQDVIDDKNKSENQEKIKKNGCVMQCLLQKEGKMKGSEYDKEIVEKILGEFSKERNAQSKMLEALNNCINKIKLFSVNLLNKLLNNSFDANNSSASSYLYVRAKDLTEKCEKSFVFTECYLKAEAKILVSPSSVN